MSTTTIAPKYLRNAETCFETLDAFAHHGGTGKPMARKKIGNNLWVERHPADNAIAVKYHWTNIVTAYPDGSFRLDTNGWHTATTRDNMNAWVPAQFSVYQYQHVLYVGWKGLTTAGEHYADEIARGYEWATEPTDPDKVIVDYRRGLLYETELVDGMVIRPDGPGRWLLCTETR